MLEYNSLNLFFGSNMWVQIFLKMREYQSKGAQKQKIEASLCTLDWGFKKIQFTLYTYVSAKILQNGVKFSYAKARFKNYRNLNNFRQVVKSPGRLNLMGFCPKKYTFLQIKHHVPWIYLTLLSTTCVQNNQITYVVFETISHFHNTTPLRLYQIKHYILSTKVAHQSTSFQTFPLLSSPIFSCHFSNKKPVFLQGLDLFSVP